MKFLQFISLPIPFYHYLVQYIVMNSLEQTQFKPKQKFKTTSM